MGLKDSLPFLLAVSSPKARVARPCANSCGIIAKVMQQFLLNTQIQYYCSCFITFKIS